MKYWDSSAIVPLLVAEKSTQFLLKLYAAEPTMLVWWATMVECASAVARLEQQNNIEPSLTHEALERLRQLAQRWHEILPNDQIRELAIRLLRVHNLRTQDSLQLAAAIIVSEHKPASLEFVCLDARLAIAAQKEGFAVIAYANT